MVVKNSISLVSALFLLSLFGSVPLLAKVDPQQQSFSTQPGEDLTDGAKAKEEFDKDRQQAALCDYLGIVYYNKECNDAAVSYGYPYWTVIGSFCYGCYN